MHRHDPRCDHCFRSSKPRLNLAEQSVFSGLAARQVASARLSPSLLQVRHGLFWRSLSAIDGTHVKRDNEKCQCRFSVQLKKEKGLPMIVTTA
jgi:hypothetical protein